MDKEVYEEFSKHCRKEGISMSKKVENFIRDELERMKGSMEIKRESVGEIKKNAGSEVSDAHPLGKYC